MKKNYFIVYIFIFFLNSAFSQSNVPSATTDYSNYINKTINKPNVFNFINYSTEGSVDQLTGKFGVNIPFHKILTPYLEIPIILSYSTSGVKIDNVSNEIGIDWNLVAGGQITRFVNDVEDDRAASTDSKQLFATGSGAYSENYLPSNYHGLYRPFVGLGEVRGAAVSSIGADFINQFPRRHDNSNHSLSEIGSLIEIKKLEQFKDEALLPVVDVDTQLDYFRVSAGELNFSFVLKRKNEIFYDQGQIDFQDTSTYVEAVPLDELAVRIKVYSGGIQYGNVDKYDSVEREEGSFRITKFEITDKKGIIYIFDKFEYFDYDVINTVDLNFPVGVNGKRAAQYKYYKTNINSWKLTKIILPNNEEVNFSYRSNNYLYQKRIPREHDGEYVGFQYNLNPKMTSYGLTRLDNHIDGYSISEINFRNQKIVFSYSNTRPDYKTGGLNLEKIELKDVKNNLIKKFDLVKYYSYVDDNGGHEEFRMFLSGIVDSQNKYSYQFSYNSSDGLPARSKVEVQDIFGYYLGKQNVYPAFPTIYISPDNLDGNKISYEIPNNSNYFVINGSDRAVKINYPKFGTMDKIIFPTKGYLKIEYENNTFYDNRLLSQMSLGPGVRVKNLIYFDHNDAVKIKKGYDYNLFANSNYSSGELLYKPSYAYLSNWSLNNQYNRNLLENISFQPNETGFVQAFDMIYFQNFYTKEMWQSQTSLNATEILRKMIHLSSHSLGSQQDIYGRELIYKNVSEKIINNEDGANNGEIRYYFKYNDNRPVISGITGPSDEISTYEKGTRETSYGAYFYPWFLSSDKYYKTSTGFMERSGKEIYPFADRNFFDGLESSLFGKLEKKEYYNASGKIVSSEDYTYTELVNSSINNNLLKNIKCGYLKAHSFRSDDPQKKFIGLVASPGSSALIANAHNFNGVYFFSVNPIKFNCKTVLKTNRVRKYFNNSATYLDEELVTYDYSNQTGNLLSELSVGSSLEDRKVMYAYPYSDSDFNWLNKLYSTNRISEPVGVFNYVNNQLIRTVNKEYFIDNQGLVFLKSIKFEKGYSLNGEPEELVQFKRYNNKGDLLEVSKKNDMDIVYLYGYDKTEVVAKIENISYSSIPSALITNIESASSSLGSETTLLSALTALRNDAALSGAMVTTYTYIPLVGLSTITDPKGDKITYTYDASGRLEFVKDKEGNIISETQYNYKQ